MYVCVCVSVLQLTVMRDGGLLGPITVSWMANVSAGGDLSPLSGNVTLAANVATATFSVNIIDDPVSLCTSNVIHAILLKIHVFYPLSSYQVLYI